ncbi:glyoxalase [bacterium]|nr:glyoxalase [bacterium]
MSAQFIFKMPVRDLDRSVEFYRQLEFAIDGLHSEPRAACLALSANLFIVLQGAEPDGENDEVIVTLPAESRAEVDEWIDRALAAGGAPGVAAQDYDWLYGRSFTDPDGHLWEVQYLNTGAALAA